MKQIKYFRTPADFRKWLQRYHTTTPELWVGYYKTNSGRPSLTWPESVDEALCFGWIDGIRKSVDELRYTIRFTPRKPSSIWSTVNIKRARALIKEGRMQPAGFQAFKARKENRSGIYSYEQRSATLVEPYATRLKKNAQAWAFFQAQPTSYQKAVNWWVVSAKQAATRLRRLEQLITDSAQGRTIAQFTRRKAAK